MHQRTIIGLQVLESLVLCDTLHTTTIQPLLAGSMEAAAVREPESSYDHIGFYIRHHVIPPEVSVTTAAQLLGVGRPALSNLLNGQAALSRQMALRLERAFGVDHEDLLGVQSSLQSKNLDQPGQAATVGRYTPSVVVIRAAQIERWSEEIDSRQKLPVLMRKLVHAVGEGLERVDFPGYDNAERHGWDGLVEAAVATPWVPRGKSGWELSTREDIKRKADEDYANRMRAIPKAEERAEYTFIFVTARNWPGKDQWVKEKTALGHWREVRAYDASDLEQWAEHSATAQIWLAELLNIPVEGYRSLERCWQNWAAVTAPRLSTKLFDPAVEAHAAHIDNWLNSGSSEPLTIAADSVDEALAFLACAGWSPSLRHHDLASRAVVFDTPEGLRRFGGGENSSNHSCRRQLGNRAGDRVSGRGRTSHHRSLPESGRSHACHHSGPAQPREY